MVAMVKAENIGLRHLEGQQGRLGLVAKEPGLHLLIAWEVALAGERAVQVVHPVDVVAARHYHRRRRSPS